MSKINITHCVSSIDRMDGGPSRSVPILCKGLSELNLNINLITYDKPNNNISLKDTKVKLICLQLESTLQNFSLRFKRELLNTHPQIFHSHGLWLPFYHWMAQYARINSIPYIITPRGTLEPFCINSKKLKKRLSMLLYQDKDIKHAACIQATGEMEALNIRNLGYKNPIAIIPNGIDLQQYPYKKKRNEGSKRHILFLSRIHPKKGLELLLEAWREIPSEILVDWDLKIVGNGDEIYIDSLKMKVKNYNLESSVFILPPTFGEKKIIMYHESDLFILPTHSENFGMVIAEALACGVPVITTKNTPWECLEKTRSGWWIDLDTESLKKTLINAMMLPFDSLVKMGANGRKCIEQNFSIESVSSKTEELYKWILLKKDRPSFVI